MNAQRTTMAIGDLLRGFLRALRALVPIAEDLGVSWREPDNYDDWDSVAAGAFEGFVLEAIRSSAIWSDCAPLVPYDTSVPSYHAASFVAVKTDIGFLPLVRFETSQEPFDVCVLSQVDATDRVLGVLRVPTRDIVGVVVLRSKLGQKTVIESATWR